MFLSRERERENVIWWELAFIPLIKMEEYLKKIL